MRAKTIIILIIPIIIFGAIGFYFLLQKEKPTATPSQPTLLPSASKKEAFETAAGQPVMLSKKLSLKINGLNIISNEPVISFSFNPEGEKVWYFTEKDGNLWEANLDGTNQTKIVSTILKDLKEVVWSYDRNKFAALFLEPSQNFVYDFQSGVSTELPAGIQALTFSPKGGQISFHQHQPTNNLNRLAVSSIAGESLKTLLSTELTRWRIFWPSNNQILISQPPSGLLTSFVLGINPATGKLNKILAELYGLEILPANAGKKIIFSNTNSSGKNLNLLVFDLEKQTLENLNLPTLAPKCVWKTNDQALICAVPTNYSNSWIWPDDYYKGKILTTDEIWLIDLTKGEKTKLLETPFDIESPKLLPGGENELFFINRGDGFLYKLQI